MPTCPKTGPNKTNLAHQTNHHDSRLENQCSHVVVWHLTRVQCNAMQSKSLFMSPMKLHVFPAAIGFVLLALVQLSYGQAMGSSPAPAPSSDGAAIDQGIAYFLLLLALAVTYLIH
ncbi:hypothetical protein GQ457_12G023350 [Hibiscus cannabinus]